MSSTPTICLKFVSVRGWENPDLLAVEVESSFDFAFVLSFALGSDQPASCLPCATSLQSLSRPLAPHKHVSLAAPHAAAVVSVLLLEHLSGR